MTPIEDEKTTMEDLLQQAEADGLWLHCVYQDLWFSPEELRRQQANGRFRWDAVNWTLRDPQEQLAEAEQRMLIAKADYERVKAKLLAEAKP